MPHTETEDEVGVNFTGLLKAAPTAVERVLDGDAAQLPHNWDAEAFGESRDFGVSPALPDAVADVEKGTFGVAQRSGDFFHVAVGRIPDA